MLPHRPTGALLLLSNTLPHTPEQQAVGGLLCVLFITPPCQPAASQLAVVLVQRNAPRSQAVPVDQVLADLLNVFSSPGQQTWQST